MRDIVSWGIIGHLSLVLLISQESFTMEASILLHLEDLSFFYPVRLVQLR